jgi:hypothetical protein
MKTCKTLQDVFYLTVVRRLLLSVRNCWVTEELPAPLQSQEARWDLFCFRKGRDVGTHLNGPCGCVEKGNGMKFKDYDRFYQVEWLIMMGLDYVSDPRPPTDLLFIPRVICEPWWWWRRLGITPDSSTRALWQSYQQRDLGQVGGMDEGVRILLISIWDTSRDLLTCRKILRHGTFGFTSHPIEDVLCIFIALINPSPLPGLNSRPLGPVAGTITTTPPRRLLLG